LDAPASTVIAVSGHKRALLRANELMEKRVGVFNPETAVDRSFTFATPHEHSVFRLR
jgi:hypothetical protein